MVASGDLKSIAYERGSLKLLDQRKLPHEKIYLDASSAALGWEAIKEMVVRGAPAIAIAAALSLAAEVVQASPQLSTPQQAAAFIIEKLNYLVSSRPTAVNLSQAAKALEAVTVEAAASNGATGGGVVEAYVAAAEKMLADDVVDNRAIGRHGAEAIVEATGKQKGLRVLTHCNTGSLATAAYGTALGVVRALQEQGRLEQAVCTETRPYNQGSRLTAFELVHDHITGTLVVDSAVAALQALGRVDAVVVGADRIAANGDTANKIGTYSIAVTAHHHGIPFFVAAPFTSIDLNTATGAGIVIEERDPKEVTHAFGGQGPAVAAQGISVWNPAFDVTPASLITGIVTEKGVITKASGANVIDIKAVAVGSPAGAVEPSLPAVNGGAGVAGNDSATYRVLNEDTVGAYLQESLPGLAARLGSSPSDVKVREVGDGNLNLVFIVEGKEGALVVKQSLPYVRCVGDSWPLSVDRALFESMALQEQFAACPAHVPEVHHIDKSMSLIVMRYIEPPHIILRKGLIAGTTYPHLADHMSDFMARTLFLTSLLAVSTSEHRAGVAKYCGNVEMCRLTEQVIFTEPYFNAANNHWTTPQLDENAKALWTDLPLKLAICRLKAKFCEQAQALLHADLHTGSVMVTQASTLVIDPEFAFYGPIGFDIGAFLGNLFLSYISQDGHATADSPREDMKQWVLVTIQETWDRFRAKFIALWDERAATEQLGDLTPSSLYRLDDGSLKAFQEEFLSEVFRDSLGFAGAKMIRRIVGIAHVADLETIKEANTRARCEKVALSFARSLVVETGEYKSIADVVARLEQVQQAAVA